MNKDRLADLLHKSKDLVEYSKNTLVVIQQSRDQFNKKRGRVMGKCIDCGKRLEDYEAMACNRCVAQGPWR